MYFNANLDLHSNITKFENKVRMIQSCIYDYFRLIDNNKDPDWTWNSLSTEYNHLSRRQRKTFLKVLKNDTSNEDSTRIRYLSKLTSVKQTEKSSKLRTEMAFNERIEKNFWKHCKEILESEDKVYLILTKQYVMSIL